MINSRTDTTPEGLMHVWIMFDKLWKWQIDRQLKCVYEV